MKLLILVVLAAGCTETPTRSVTQDETALACYRQCTEMVRAQPAPALPAFKDARDYAIVALADRIAGPRPNSAASCVGACNLPAVSYEKTVQVHNQERTEQIAAGAGPLRTAATAIPILAGGKAAEWILKEATGDSNTTSNTSVANSEDVSTATRGDALGKRDNNPYTNTSNNIGDVEGEAP